jgi:hypothetical protein
MKKIALLALPFAGAALVLAAPAGATPKPAPAPPHPAQTLLTTAGKAVVGVVGQAEAEINGTLYNLGFRPYI